MDLVFIGLLQSILIIKPGYILSILAGQEELNKDAGTPPLNVRAIRSFSLGSNVSAPAPAPVVPVFVRNPMTCYQVWVNAKGNFEFLFWYLYADSNWIKIYDKSGKEVYSMNIPIDSPVFEVSLPDGIYTVKTFTDNRDILQTFTIGKDANTPHQDLAGIE